MFHVRVVAPMGVTLPPKTRFVNLNPKLLEHRRHVLVEVAKDVHEAKGPVSFIKGDVVKIDGPVRGPAASALVDVRDGHTTVGQMQDLSPPMAVAPVKPTAKGGKSKLL